MQSKKISNHESFLAVTYFECESSDEFDLDSDLDLEKVKLDQKELQFVDGRQT